MQDLDTKIKEKFKLFQGLRTQEEDQKIYDKVMEFCFDETMTFLGENLDDSERSILLEEMKSNDSEEGKTKLLQSYFSKLNDSKITFAIRMDNFLNNLLYSSLKETQKTS